jgi:hypothetical protein
VWILPSRGRPQNLRRLYAAYQATGATTPVWLRLDEDDPTLEECLSTPLRSSWRRIVGPRLPLSQIYAEAYQWAREWYSSSGWYGFLADDVVPETPLWDVQLIEVAGQDGMAVPSGGDPTGAPHFVLGAGLVNEIGWLCLPGLDRLYIDTVWRDIATARNVLRWVPEVTLMHRHFSTGWARYDITYQKLRKDQDRALYEAWRNQED